MASSQRTNQMGKVEFAVTLPGFLPPCDAPILIEVEHHADLLFTLRNAKYPDHNGDPMVAAANITFMMRWAASTFNRQKQKFVTRYRDLAKDQGITGLPDDYFSGVYKLLANKDASFQPLHPEVIKAAFHVLEKASQATYPDIPSKDTADPFFTA